MASRLNETVLLLLSDGMNNRKFLYDLCLVSRSFNAAFSKRLWRCLEINARNKHCLIASARRDNLLGSKNLQLVRILIYKNKTSGYFADRRVYVEPLKQLIEKLPGLQTIAFEEMEVPTNLLAAVFGVSKLRSLSLKLKFITMDKVRYMQSPDGPATGPNSNEFVDSEIEKVKNRFIDEMKLLNVAIRNDLDSLNKTGERMLLELPSFERSRVFPFLTRLTILSMFGNMNYWSAWLLEILIGSPCLKHLSLSISSWLVTERRCLPLPYIQPCRNFFSGLCKAYGKKATVLLKLRSLRLAYPIQFPDRSTLSALTDTKHLEELYICNYDWLQAGYTLPSDVLSPRVTPALTRLFLRGMDKSILEQQDKIFDSTSRQISTLGVEDWAGGEGVQYMSISKLVGRVPNILIHMRNLNEKFLSTAQEYLLHTGSTKQLSIAVDSGCIGSCDFFMGPDFVQLCVMLGRMEALEALWIVHTRGFLGTRSRAHQSNLRLITSTLLEDCRKLRYLKIDNMAWRVHRSDQQAEPGRGAPAGRAERLDSWEDEVECPRLFHTPEPLPGWRTSHHVDW
ncbi:hypothetical protein LLEC1_02070 [Akanthomyces lecanii]|uniref:Uncharacterized protein n=1 Tax=Cordyceps confragosa TaxID=2714763 RepID=A0A179IGU2_CORDF|nr:hypothetical protein LLEC1_02070 [Akanthomyces lecanii]